jgi:Tol biopolymer transport system component
MYDRNTNTTARITDAVVWDLAVSPTKDALAYTKVGETRREQYVWLLPLSAATGLPSGKERKVSTHAGDAPSISPDGKRIAFARDDETGVGQTVVVVPVVGGSERVLASAMPAGVSGIRWSPDGTKVYFGVNPPVPFTCAESCLTGARESRPAATIRRVASNGGVVETIATVGAPAPGLSPDGKFVVFGDTGAPRRLIVADADGHRLKAFSVNSPQNPHTWTGASTLLTLATGESRRVRSLPLQGSAPRTLFETNEFRLESSWTPDGRSASVLRIGCQVSVINNDDTRVQRSIALAKSGNCFSATWTADQRWVVFTHYRPDDKPALAAVEVTTGQTKDLRAFADNNPPQWVVDRDVVLFAEPVRGGDGSRQAIWQVDLGGTARVLRELVVGDGAVTVLDRNQVLVMRKGSRDARVVALPTGDERTITVATAGFVLPRAFLSADRQWVAFLVSPTGTDNTQLTRLELVKLDQTERRTIDLPFPSAPFSNLSILPGAAGAVVADRLRPDNPASVFLVDASTKSTTKLFSYVAAGRPAEFTLSPDGRTLLYLVTEPLPPTISAVDITTIR